MHLEKLDLTLLVAIDALLRTQSVTAAAVELNLTQSAVSSALNRARAHFQDEIFHYDGQKMRCSPFGQSLAEMVPELINRLSSLARMRASAELHTLERQITVIASDYVAAVFLSVLSKRLSICAPNVSLAVVPFSEDAIGNFHRGKIDFLVAQGFWVDDTLLRAPLFNDGFHCVVCKDNPFAKTGLSFQSYLDAPHVVTNFFVGDGKSHFENWLMQEDFLSGSPPYCPALWSCPTIFLGLPA